MEIWGRLKNERLVNSSIIIALVVLNIIIKSIYLSDYNIELDEPFSLFHSQKTLGELYEIFIRENNPPLFYVILHFWIKLFGIGVISARFLPMIFSSLAVIYVYKIGNKFLNQKIALGASLLYTFSNTNLMEAHDCRVYSLLVLLGTASMYFYFSLIESEKKDKYWIALTITNILLIYAHFLAFFILFLQVFCTIVFRSVRTNIFKKHLFSSILLFVSYLPYLYFFIIRFTQTMKIGIHKPPVQLADIYNSFLSILGNTFLVGNNFLLIFVTFTIYIIISRLKLSIYELMILGWFLLLFLLTSLVSLKIQLITIPKYLILITPGFFLSLMIAADHLSKSSKSFNGFIWFFCISLMIFSSDLNYSQRFDSKKTVSYIQNQKMDSSLVFISPPWIDIVYTYHYNINAFKDYNNYTKYLNDQNIFILATAKDIDLSKLNQASDIFLLDGWDCMKISDPNRTILGTLSKKFNNKFSIINFSGYTIYHFKSRISDRSSIP